jgi:hypothetical protein
MRLFPAIGTLGTKPGRTALLLPPFSGEWPLVRVGPTVLASTGRRLGPDPGRSTGTAGRLSGFSGGVGVLFTSPLTSTGRRLGPDPGRSTGKGV